MMVYNAGRAVQVSYGGNLSRKEEREALGKLADTYRQWNENYRQTGCMPGLMETNELKGLLDGMPKGELRPFEAPSFIVELSPEAQEIVKRNVSNEFPANETAEYSPVTEIRSEHFRWTEADGIEETVTEAEELAVRQEAFREVFQSAVSQSIGEILKPRATYEEAFDALYAREGVAWKSSFDDSNYGFTQILTPVNGAFGALATHLNDYLEQFGVEDGYFDTLCGALNELDTGGDNALLGQIRDMVQTVRNGNTIKTQSEEFKNDVQNAIVESYVATKRKTLRQKDKKDGKGEEQVQGGLSYLDMQRHKAKEEKQLLDKLTGKGKSNKSESVGEVLAQCRKNKMEGDFQDKLRKVDEQDSGERENRDASTGAKAAGTALDKEDWDRLTTKYNAWNSISERYGWGTIKTEREQ